MDARIKCEIYTKLLGSLNKHGELNEEINANTYDNILKLIKSDFLSKVSSGQETALQILRLLIENNVQNIQQDVIAILKDDDVDQELRTSILDSIRSYINDLLHSSNVADLASLYSNWKNYDLEKFYELLASACLQGKQDASQSEPIKFGSLIIDHFFPLMLSPNQVSPELFIEVATKIAKMYPISNLSTEEYQHVLKKIPGLLTNLVHLQDSKSDAWQKPLHFLTEYLDEKIYDPEVREMFSKSSLNWDLVQIELDNNMNVELIKYISENNLVLVTRLFRGWRNLDPHKFRTALRETCQSTDYIKYCKTFFFSTLVPVIMAPKDMCDPMKVCYIDIALEFASTLPLARLTSEEYNSFIASVNDYIKNISDLRDMNFEHWHKLWIFLVRLFGKKLHHSMSLINRLLRVVEHAFRNSSHEQRLRGYDCWKELIDNVSLDSQHISSEKQIRLLLTPLRAKFSKQEAVIVKRFEVFVYLIEKLQDKAVLVLKEFLEFCFGEVGEDTDPNKCGQGKSLPELWHRSAKVLLAMLGHSHDSTEHCLETETEISLRVPVLNSNNISNHYCHTINSVVEACMLLKEVELKQDKSTVLKCFWTSLLGIILDESVANKDKCIETVGKAFEKLFKDNDPYYESIAAEILKTAIKFDWAIVSPLILNNLKYFIRIIFSVPLGNESYLEIEKFQILLCTLESTEVTSKIAGDLFHCFAEYQTIESNANFVAQFWNFLVNELDDYAKNKCLNFLVWPALHLHHVTDSVKEVLLYEHYKQIVTKFVEKSDDLQLGLFKNFEKILKHNPLLSKNILTLITMFSPKTENHELTNVILNILDLMMVIPTTENSINQRQNLELYLKKFYESNVANNYDHDTIKKLCTCLQHMLKLKHYDILNTVEPYLKSLPDKVKWVHGKFLTLDFLMDLFDKETVVSSAEKIRKLIDIFRNVKNPDTKKDITSFMPLGGRSAKIAKLVKEIPSSPNKRSDSPITLRLFGKDIDTLSPLNVKGSQLKDKKDTPSKGNSSTLKKTPRKSICIDDESNSKFVLIETEVKLDKNKLTEHQKEALKKRREDIPALYQDLSQSMTQSECLDSNSATVKLENNASIFKKPEENYCKKAEQSLNIEQETKNIKLPDDAKTVTTLETLTTIQTQVSEVKGNESMQVDDITETDKSETDPLENEDQNKELDKAEIKIQQLVEAELKKLSMSIVGAEEFLATSSKRNRRQKKRDLEENKEKSDKERRNRSLTRANEDQGNENPVLEKNDRAKEQEGNLRRKSVSNKQLAKSSVQEPLQQISNTKGESDSASNDIEGKSTESGNVIKKDIKLPAESVSSARANVDRTEKLDKGPTGNEIETKESEMLKNKKRKSVPIKNDPSEVFFKDKLNNETNKREEQHNLPLENQSQKEQTSETSGLIIAAKNAEFDNAPQPVVITFKVNRRGRRSKSKSSKSPSPTKKSETRPQSPVKTTKDTKVVSLLETETEQDDKSSPIEDGDSDGRRKKKRRRLGIELNLPKEDFRYKTCEEVVKIEPSDIDVYQFDTEQERASEAEIVPLRSPNKDNKLSSSINDTPNVCESSPAKEVTKIKRNLVSSETCVEEATPSVGRKSQRRSIPTKKFSPSEAFKSSEPMTHTPGRLKSKKSIASSPKVLQSSNEDNMHVPSSTQSELFKQTNEEICSVEHLITSRPESTRSDNSKVFEAVNKESVIIKQPNTEMLNMQVADANDDTIKDSVTEKSKPITSNNNPKLREDVLRKGIKRRRPSSEDDDDIIESSQESATSNISASKLKQSLTKRSSFEKPFTAEVKQNIADVIKTDEIIDKELLVHGNTDKTKVDVTPEERNKKRGRPFKCPWKNNSTNVDTNIHDRSNPNTSKTHESKIQNQILECGTISEKKKPRRGRPPRSPLKNDMACAEGKVDEECRMTNDINNADTNVHEDPQLSVETNTHKLDDSKIQNITIKFAVTTEIKKPRRGRRSKSPAKDGVPFAENKVSEGCRMITDTQKTDKSSETLSDNDTTKLEVTPEGKPQINVTAQDELCEQILNNTDTPPEQRKSGRGRPKRSPTKSNALFESDRKTNEMVAIEESQSLVSTRGKSSRNSEETVVAVDKLKSKRKRRRKNNEEIGEITIHMLEAIERAASSTMASDEKPEFSRQTSPVKTQEVAKDMQDVKVQATVEEFMEPVNLDMSTGNPQRTQSQDTQTQDTESMDNCDEIQLQLDLPQNPVLNETDKDLARMDTASLSLGNLDELKGFNTSTSDEIGVESNKTVIENKTLTEDISELECDNFSRNVEHNCTDVHVMDSELVTDESKINMKDETLKKDLLESEFESIIESTEETKSLAKSSEHTEIQETENINTEESDNIDIQEKMVVEHGSPIKEQSASNCMGTPEPLETSLPSSPVTGDTPSRTSELLNCTSDISPIASKSSSDKSSSDDEFIEQRKLVPVALKFDEDADHEANKEKSPEKADDAPEKINEMSPDKTDKDVDQATSSSPPKDEAKTSRDIIKNIAERSSKFFDMVKSGSPSTIRLFSKRKSGLNMSPSTSRIKKLMSNIKVPSQNEINDNESQEDLLTFTREVPSPLAVPRSSILKRKHSDTSGDDGLSPCPKRKRVNFSDPCTTSKKVFIKEDNVASQCLFGAASDDDLDKQFLEVLAANSLHTESDIIETEQSLQVNNPLLLRDDIPIYPDLVDCEDSVSVISRKLTSPMFVNALLSKFKSRDIRTIGDLAKQSEVSIARLPFKTPMVANVYKALDNYYHRNFKSKLSKEKYEARINGEPKTDSDEVTTLRPLEVTLVKMDVKDELSKVLERAKLEGMPADTLCSIILSVLDQKEVLTYIKTHMNFETKDIIDGEDYPKIVKHLTETVGVSKVFEVLSEAPDSFIYFDEMVKKSIEEKPLGTLIRKRTLPELRAALWQNVDRGIYTKEDLLATCFIPYVNFIDLTPAFNRLNLVEIEDLVVSRLRTEDYPMFVKRILKKCSSNTEVKEEVLNYCTVTELTANILQKASRNEIEKPFTHIFLSVDKSRADVLEVFRIVTDAMVANFPPSQLMEFSIEFQKKIPIKD